MAGVPRAINVPPADNLKTQSETVRLKNDGSFGRRNRPAAWPGERPETIFPPEIEHCRVPRIGGARVDGPVCTYAPSPTGDRCDECSCR